ncbi:hypothetical protein BC938DRAFT_470784 [Jimgerdemannia flammicorona]|uniref:Uncharacterized protein n=1 Tax=Jimgerdemannia flammicorona TaxID=994334 RepID=A0A433Q9G6_9FUNG|nr:hypothetical protein BC938DRAFT_470784 [Jimgerdemannia flammicorona]
MADTNWCTFCDKSISPFSNSLYCSDECMNCDTTHHPILGYSYEALQDFPRSTSSSAPSTTSSTSTSPTLSYAVVSPTFLPYMGTTNVNKVSPPSFSLGQSAHRSSHNIYTKPSTRPFNVAPAASTTKRVFFF